MKEFWKENTNYPDYKISNKGKIKSYKRRVPNILSYRVNRNKGYFYVHIKDKHGKWTHKAVHRIIAETFIPNTNKKQQVNHKDGNKLNNSVNNLEWVTQSENLRHAFKRGLISRKGEKNSCSKLTEQDVLIIRDGIKNGIQGRFYAKKYSVSDSVISGIKLNKTWTHI